MKKSSYQKLKDKHQSEKNELIGDILILVENSDLQKVTQVKLKWTMIKRVESALLWRSAIKLP